MILATQLNDDQRMVAIISGVALIVVSFSFFRDKWKNSSVYARRMRNIRRKRPGYR